MGKKSKQVATETSTSDQTAGAVKGDQLERRRFVRIEITSPASLNRIKDIFGNYWPHGEDYTIPGTILNISTGGVLLDLEHPVNEGDVVALRFSLQKRSALEGVLGLVKRCDHDDEGNLTGVEFVDRKHLVDRLSGSEMDLLAEHFDNFSCSLEQFVKRCLEEERA
jgi:hypothetical protein